MSAIGIGYFHGTGPSDTRCETTDCTAEWRGHRFGEEHTVTLVRLSSQVKNLCKPVGENTVRSTIGDDKVRAMASILHQI